MTLILRLLPLPRLVWGFLLWAAGQHGIDILPKPGIGRASCLAIFLVRQRGGFVGFSKNLVVPLYGDLPVLVWQARQLLDYPFFVVWMM